MNAAFGRHVLVLICLIGPAGCAPRAPQLAPPSAPPAAGIEQPRFRQTGLASWYGPAHRGLRTANGERFNPQALTAAHRTLAIGSIVRVTDLATGKSVKVRINDRGPHVRGRIIDLSVAAAQALGVRDDGVSRVKLEVFASDQ